MKPVRLRTWTEGSVAVMRWGAFQQEPVLLVHRVLPPRDGAAYLCTPLSRVRSGGSAAGRFRAGRTALSTGPGSFPGIGRRAFRPCPGGSSRSEAGCPWLPVCAVGLRFAGGPPGPSGTPTRVAPDRSRTDPGHSRRTRSLRWIADTLSAEPWRTLGANNIVPDSPCRTGARGRHAGR